MNEPAEALPHQSPNQPAPAPARGPLTASLIEAGDAVHHELREAQDLAANLDAELAAKSKEVLHLKFVLDRTKAHFGHLQDSVTALRKERHQLANDVMKAQGACRCHQGARPAEDRTPRRRPKPRRPKCVGSADL